MTKTVICMFFPSFFSPPLLFFLHPPPAIGDMHAVVARGPYDAGHD